MDDLTTLLSRIGLFDALSPERMAKITPAIPAKAFEAGEHVFTPAYRGEVFFLLLEGQVRIYRLQAAREVTLGVLEAGEVFGEAAFTSREGKGSYAQAIGPSKIAFLNRSTFYRLLRRDPEVAIRAIEILSERLSFYEGRIEDISLKKVPARLASVILQLAKQDGIVIGDGRYRIRTRYTHEQLATMIGAKRVAVSRAMKDLREAEALESGSRNIVVKDALALGRIAEEAA